MQIFNCSSLHLPIPDKSVHCIVTSPPYYGLREYKDIEPQIWLSGSHPLVKDCVHSFDIENIIPPKGGRTAPDNPPGTGSCKIQQEIGSKAHFGGMRSFFCSKCGSWYGHFGNEPTVELYIEHTMMILDELKRVLRDDGVLWWNLGDSSCAGKRKTQVKQTLASTTQDIPQNFRNEAYGQYKNGDLMLVPEHFIIAAQKRGWIVRDKPVWWKDNPMPESIKGWRWVRHKIRVKDNPPGSGEQKIWIDCPGCEKCTSNEGLVLRYGAWRHTDSYEMIYMLTKTMNYYSDGDGVLEVYTKPINRWAGTKLTTPEGGFSNNVPENPYKELNRDRIMRPNAGGKNPRNVWKFPVQPFGKGHWAAFPEELPRRCILSSTPEKVCEICGEPFARIIVEEKDNVSRWGLAGKTAEETAEIGKLASADSPRKDLQVRLGPIRKSETLGWKKTCACSCEGTAKAVVLDPFCGSGTTVGVAELLGREGIGVELSSKYIDIIKDRVQSMVKRGPKFRDLKEDDFSETFESDSETPEDNSEEL